MKNKIFLLCLLVFAILFCACSKNSNESVETNSSTKTQENENGGSIEGTENVEEVTTQDEASKVPNKEKIINDLSEKNCNVISFTEMRETITIPITEITFDKARKEDQTYLAYCTVVMKDDYYDAKITYSLTYGYYDIGGWVLDEYKEEKREINILKIDDGFAQAYIRQVCMNSGWFEPTKLEYENSYSVQDNINNAWVCFYSKVCSRKYADLNYRDSFQCSFDSTTGWKFSNLNSTFIYDDWSKFVGKKFYTGVLDGSSFYIEILKFDTLRSVVSVKISGHTDNGWVMYTNYSNAETGEYKVTSKTIYDMPETVFEMKLDWNDTMVVDYFFKNKNNDFMYGSDFTYELIIAEGWKAAIEYGDISFNYDMGISDFDLFNECWTYGIPEVK